MDKPPLKSSHTSGIPERGGADESFEVFTALFDNLKAKLEDASRAAEFLPEVKVIILTMLSMLTAGDLIGLRSLVNHCTEISRAFIAKREAERNAGQNGPIQ